MIQRIQSLYFLIAVALLALSFASSYFSFKIDDISYDVAFQGVNKLLNNVTTEKKLMFWLPITLQILALIATILLFKNRKMQVRMGWLSFFLNLGTTAWIYFAANSFFTSQAGKTGSDFVLEMGFFVHASAFLFIFLGIQGVRKDKKLIDSLNRLR
jgi:hypothetical protein